MKYTPEGIADNALQRVVLIVEFEKPFSQSDYQAVDSASAEWKIQLPRRSVSHAVVFQPGLNRVEANEQSIASLSYEALMRDGNPEFGLRIEGNAIMYLIGRYTRWDDMWPNASSALKRVLGLVSRENKVRSYATEYTDLFRALGSYADFQIGGIIRPECRFLAPHVYTQSLNWHSHTGYFEELKEPVSHRALHRINVDLRDNASEKSRDLSVVLFHSIMGNVEPFGDTAALPEAIEARGIENFRALHDMDKAILREILNDDMCTRIGL